LDTPLWTSIDNPCLSARCICVSNRPCFSCHSVRSECSGVYLTNNWRKQNLIIYQPSNLSIHSILFYSILSKPLSKEYNFLIPSFSIVIVIDASVNDKPGKLINISEALLNNCSSTFMIFTLSLNIKTPNHALVYSIVSPWE
jgi:hypothetical protein